VSRFPAEVIAALEPALRAARAALRDLDADEVPAGVRKVAAHSAAKLPPPLAASLVRELDRSAWLRDKAIEKLVGDEPAAAASFLSRPEGWWAALAAAASEVGSTVRAGADATTRKDAERLERLLAQAKEKQRAHDKGHRAQVAALNVELAAAGGRSREERRHDEADEVLLRSDLARQSAVLAEKRDDLVQAETAVRRLTERARDLRRRLAAAERRLAAGESTATRDPVAAARALDLAAAAGARRPAGPRAGEVAASARRPPPELRVPPGVAPDTAAAVDWLVGLDVGFTLVVDGYNVLFQLEPAEFTTGRARRRLVDLLGGLAGAAPAVRRVLVVFDSTLPGERDTRRVGDKVEQRFAPSDRLADEEVVDLAASEPAPVVVVSSDREVREGAEAVGAVALWSQALVEWARHRQQR
jgi:predicted RNA-binding protein with PIN domain